MSSKVDSCTTSTHSCDTADEPLPSHDSVVTTEKHAQLQRTIHTFTNVNSEANRKGDPTPSTSPAPNSLHSQHRILHPGRWIKDKWTHTTHEERELDQIAKAERVRHTREAMEIAMATGEKQLVGRDGQGQDVYVQPPSRSQYYASGYSPYGYGGYGYGCYGYGGFGAGLALDSLLLGSLFFW